jgi:hypothetical protein
MVESFSILSKVVRGTIDFGRDSGDMNKARAGKEMSYESDMRKRTEFDSASRKRPYGEDEQRRLVGKPELREGLSDQGRMNGNHEPVSFESVTSD